MNRTVTPLAQIPGRMPEQGRIRLGEKYGQAMRAIDTFRFTSPDGAAIQQLAARYGGEPRPWNEPLASVKNQWEVKTTSSIIDIALPPGALTVWYELWSKSGRERQCDGTTCVQTLPSGFEREVDCPCGVAGALACTPKTRMTVVLPGVKPFGGVWRLETSSWNALRELQGMEALITGLQENSGRLLVATLALEQRTKRTKNGVKHFVVPRLALGTSIEGLMAGQAALSPVQIQPGTPMPAALPPGDDADVVEAELVEDDDVNLKEWQAKIAATYQLSDEAERCSALAPLVVQRYPWLGDDEHALDLIALVATRGTSDYAGLNPGQRTKLVQVLTDLVEDRAVAEPAEGGVRLKRV